MEENNQLQITKAGNSKMEKTKKSLSPLTIEKKATAPDIQRNLRN